MSWSPSEFFHRITKKLLDLFNLCFAPSWLIKMNLSQFVRRFLAVCPVNSIYFSSKSEAGLVDAGVKYGNLDTAYLGGKGLAGGVKSS